MAVTTTCSRMLLLVTEAAMNCVTRHPGLMIAP